MSNEQLIAAVVRQVLRRLAETESPPEVLILAAREDEYVAPLLDQLGPDAGVGFWMPSDSCKGAARVILPRLSCTQLADLASGRASDPVSAKVLELLLGGVGVEVFSFEYRRYRATAPAKLLALYESYVAILQGFGLRAFGEGQQKVGSLAQMLVTEADIRSAHKQGVQILNLPAAARLTPLARDCARERGMQINQSERRNQ